MSDRIRPSTEFPPGDSGSSIIRHPQEPATACPSALGARPGEAAAARIRSKIRECRRCVRQLYALTLEVLAILGLASIFWWHFQHDFRPVQQPVTLAIPAVTK